MNLKEAIKHVVRYEYMSFMKYPNVVGVGYGDKYINNINIGQLCIQVYVEKKYPKGYNSNECIPKYYFGILTDVIESGKFVVTGFDAKIRPVRMGYEIRADYSNVLLGTAGCLVTRPGARGNYEFFILSNNHIISDNNRIPIGTPILQPKLGISPGDYIGNLYQFVPLKFIMGESKPENLVDAAIIKIANINLVSPRIAFMKIPRGIDTKVEKYQILEKSGAETGYTIGKVISPEANIIVDFLGGRKAYFVDQIITTKMSEKGDSGAVALNEDNHIAGMIFSATDEYTAINKIENIQTFMDVSVYTQE